MTLGQQNQMKRTKKNLPLLRALHLKLYRCKSGVKTKGKSLWHSSHADGMLLLFIDY
jgi:hypothetical protein